MTLATEVELLDRTLDPLFSSNPALGLNGDQLPSFLTWDETDFFIQGSDYTEAWQTFSIQVRATVVENPDSALETSYLLKVKTIIDCFSGLEFALPNLFTAAVTHAIGIGVKRVTYDQATDSISTLTGINNICGPVAYDLYLSDANGVSKAALPQFL